VELEVIPTCRELGIGFMAYSPLGRGFLTGSIKSPDQLSDGDFRKSSPRFQGVAFNQNVELVNKITEFAKVMGVTPAQLALAWVLAQGNDVVPIPGTKRQKYLQENVSATVINLTEDELALLDKAAPLGIAQGNRYSDMSAVEI
jgi:aryl-alcohol dehydrogenase-like predicted oxidoreductase